MATSAASFPIDETAFAASHAAYLSGRATAMSVRQAHLGRIAKMRCPHNHATPDSKSHFDKIEIPTTKGQVFRKMVLFEQLANYPASHIRLTRIRTAMREVGYHTIPERVPTARLDGPVEYETSDGEVRHVQAGAVVLVEDTLGNGHISRDAADGQPVILITLPKRSRSAVRVVRS